ncbi:N-acetylmuramoyl-L-alanine amidase [Halodurantibacterium flavum]|uniref:N-acetylmuramoyl-L-alanine amidase n=1 Tax=Halodurantibacterium flavum TaxID=1382802 RepID=A0ABW4S6B0_9RHOB
MSSLRIFRRAALIAALTVWAAPSLAQAPATVRAEPAASTLDAGRRAIRLTLGLGAPVAYRLRTVQDPPRLVVELEGLDWNGLDPALLMDGVSRGVTGLRIGEAPDGWARMVIELDGPWGVRTAATQREGDLARLNLELRPVPLPEFLANAGTAEEVLWGLPRRAVTEGRAVSRQHGGRPLVVALDPGHGGIDPGAERGGLREAHLMLTFARELKEYMLRAGDFRVVLTREADVFVPLEARQSIARAAGADVFLSLHADALADGDASGTTIYTLAEDASDAASASLAERHDRADLLAGLDLGAHDDLVAQVLLSMARTETSPRTDRLADALATRIEAHAGPMHKRPLLQANFSVLRAADIPSVLIELGFMSNDADLARLRSPSWRAQMAEGIIAGLQDWRVQDAAAQEGLRR